MTTAIDDEKEPEQKHRCRESELIGLVMQLSPLKLIVAMSETGSYIKTIYTQGDCYRFHLMLKKIWPRALPVINASNDHVATIIDGVAYDITGVVDWSYRAMDDEDIERAERWSFAGNAMLQIGECPTCEEPMVA